MCFKDKGCGSNFIMTSATRADNLPRPEFSSCSLTDIKDNMDMSVDRDNVEAQNNTNSGIEDKNIVHEKTE